jgi:hypothetical protein
MTRLNYSNKRQHGGGAHRNSRTEHIRNKETTDNVPEEEYAHTVEASTVNCKPQYNKVEGKLPKPKNPLRVMTTIR